MTGQRALLRDGLASTPADVARMTRGLDVGPHPAPAVGWALVGTLVHLVTVERRAAANLRLAADGDHAVLVDEHAGPADVPIGASDLAQLADGFATARRATLDLLDALPRGGGARPVRHPVLGTVRVIALARRLLDHDLTHLGRLAEQRRWARADRGREPVHG